MILLTIGPLTVSDSPPEKKVRVGTYGTEARIGVQLHCWGLLFGKTKGGYGQHGHPGGCIPGLHILGRIVADARPAADEDHAGLGDLGEVHGIVAGPAGKLQEGDPARPACGCADLPDAFRQRNRADHQP